MPTRKNSKKRQVILEALAATTAHPTAQELYQQLKPDYPDLSLGTVYRNLSLFAEEGDAMSVGVFRGQERFDARTVCSAAGSSTCRCPASRRRSCVPSPRA